MLLDHTTTTPTPVRPSIRPVAEPLVTLTTVESPPTPPTRTRKPIPSQVWVAVAAAGLVGWAFYPTLDWLVGKWWNDPSYSHGFLVPLMAAVLVWLRGKTVTAWFSAPQPLVAAGVLAGVLGVRLVAGGLLFHQLDCLGLLVSVSAGVLAVGGWRLVKNCWPGLVYLVFFIPLPYEMEQNLGAPLKGVATVSSTFLLQTFGLPAVIPGNTGFVIQIEDTPIEVADACNGLKMLLTFAAIGGAAAFLLRGWFQKLMVVLGVLPIAVASNVIRITATGVLFHLLVRDPDARHAVHDALGYAMAVLGVGLLLLELWVLNRLIVKPQPVATLGG